MGKAVKKRPEIDMLNGPLLGKIILFTIPLAITSILQQLFNSADSIIAGQLIGSSALAAIGGVMPVINLFVTLMVGLSVGANVVAAVHIGRGEPDRIRGTIQTTAMLALACSVLFTAVSLVLVDSILSAINIPADVWGEAVEYLHVYFCGFTFFFVYNFGSAVLRAKGDSRRPLYALALAAALNIVFDYIAVAVFNAGVAGIAWATVASNGVAAAIVVWILLTETDPFKLTFSGFAVSLPDLREILHIGIPTGLQGVIFALSNVVVQGAINGFGTQAVAGSAAAMNYEIYAYFFVGSFSQAAVTFIGQNYAAGQLKRCDSIVKICAVAAVVSSFLIAAVPTALSDTALGLFITDETALAYGGVRLFVIALFEFMTSSYEVPAGAMRGMGVSMLPTAVTVLGVCVLRIAFVVVVFPGVGTWDSIMLLYPFTWVVTGTAMILLYVVVRKRAFAKRSENNRIATAA